MFSQILQFLQKYFNTMFRCEIDWTVAWLFFLQSYSSSNLQIDNFFNAYIFLVPREISAPEFPHEYFYAS